MQRILFKKSQIKLIYFSVFFFVIMLMFSPLFARQNEAAVESHPNNCYQLNENYLFSNQPLNCEPDLLSNKKHDKNNNKIDYLPDLLAPQEGYQFIDNDKINPLNILHAAASKDWNNITTDKINREAKTKIKSTAQHYFLTPLQQKIQSLLAHLWQAQFNLSVDDHGRFSKSNALLLTPWYDSKQQLFFSQMGIHNQQGRVITNFGIGQRFDIQEDNWRWGYNIFLDYDLSRHHRRLGMGLETSIDYFKLATNYYYPLSKWRGSADMKDFLERPAQGFDIRGQGYLPAYPQFGISVKYEQYFGDQVALFGVDKKTWQQDPYSVTFGLDYTPFTLATINISHKQGQKDHKDTQFGLTLNYQWGVPLNQQLDPQKVAERRSLKGSRFDIVDRNYNIVLEYKEKQIISVDLPPVPAGLLEGDSYTLQPLFKSKYPISKIRWLGDKMALSLLPTAGDLNPQGWKITIPAWQPISKHNNTYRLALEITDQKGNTAISNDIHILSTHHRKGKLSVVGDNSATASGADTDAILLKINLQDHKGMPIQNADIKPSWHLVKTDGKKVPLVMEKSCPNDSNGQVTPCVRIVETTKKGGENKIKLISSLPGNFKLAASMSDYGESNSVSLSFNETGSRAAVVRVEVIDAKKVDLLSTKSIPLIGERYQVKFYAKNGEDITQQIPANSIKWWLHGENIECNASLNDHDTVMRGYTFTPRRQEESNTGLTCGDQGFKIKVTY
ncbi:inverse autotransporter beta domain-containing protein [Candidatus Regiella insecticola]|nr:inverse autotransporter beta domain-containing protein [Candidatus Regiella insecticola]